MSIFARSSRENPHDKEHAGLYLDEARGRLSRMRARSASMDSRAGLLISSTAIATALKVGPGRLPADVGLSAAAGIAAFLAILLGLLVLRAASGAELDGDELRKRIRSEENDPDVDSFWVADKHFQHAVAGEAAAKNKAKLLNWGFFSLAIAVALSLLS